MFRLLTRSALVLLLLTGVSTVGAMLIGRLRPAPTPHLVVTEPRLDQWTAVKLLSLDDSVAVNRYLPIRIHGMTWQSDADNLDVLGMRNQTQRMYKINYEAQNSRIQWKAAINAHSNMQRLVSPNFEWELVPVADTENAEDLEFHVIPYVDGGTPDLEPVTYTRQWRIVNTIWSRHSDWVIYSKISNQLSNALMHYYLYDIATQSEIMLSDSAITFPAVSQDQTKIMYS